MRKAKELKKEIERMEEEAENAKNINNPTFANRLYNQIDILKWCLEPPEKKLKLIKESTYYSNDHDVICVQCLKDCREPHRVLLNDAYLDITERVISPDYYCLTCAYEVCSDMKYLKESEIKRKEEAKEWSKL